MPARMIHVRLPPDLDETVRAAAQTRGRSLQSIYEAALKEYVNGSEKGEVLGLEVFENRFSPTLERCLISEIHAAQDVSVLGTDLHDFVLANGWGARAFNLILESTFPVRIGIQDKESDAAASRFKKASVIGQLEASRYTLLEHTEEILQECRSAAADRITTRKYADYPVVRWMIVTNRCAFVEHHCPKSISASASEGRLPVYLYREQSDAYSRYEDHFRYMWDEAVEL